MFHLSLALFGAVAACWKSSLSEKLVKNSFCLLAAFSSFWEAAELISRCRSCLFGRTSAYSCEEAENKLCQTGQLSYNRDDEDMSFMTFVRRSLYPKGNNASKDEGH
jgi:hypothetical protein